MGVNELGDDDCIELETFMMEDDLEGAEGWLSSNSVKYVTYLNNLDTFLLYNHIINNRI